MATAPSPNDLTRQQLDELDALLQRMLALPLNSTDTPAPARPAAAVVVSPPAVAITVEPPPLPDPVPSAPVATQPRPRAWRVDSPAVAIAPAPHLLLDPVGDPEPAIPFTPPAAFAPAPTPTPPPAPVVPAPEPATYRGPEVLPMAEPVPEPEPEPNPLTFTRPDPTPEPPVASFARPAPTPAVPPPDDSGLLVGFNRVFDNLFGMLGPVGQVLRSGFGKNLFGLVGIGLLLYTIAHVVQVQGWLTLPVAVPWPAR